MQKEKQLVPKLRFSEFEGEWEKIKLEKICKFFSGGTPTSSNKNFYTGSIPFIGSGNIFDSKVDKYINEDALKSSSAKLVEEGDILYALYGANSGDVSISKIAGAINQAILCIRTEENKNFLYQRLSYKKTSIVNTYLQGGQGNLSAKIVKKISVNFPPLPEQQKIADFLSAVDNRIQNLEKKKELLEQYKKGITQKIFKQEIRFKDDDGKAFPEWEEKKLGYYFVERKEKGLENYPLYSLTIEDGVIPKSKRYEREFLVGDTKDAYKVMYKNDFAFNPMNLRFGALKRFKGDIMINVSKYYNIFYCNEKGSANFFDYYLTSYNMIQYYNKMATGTLEEKKRVHYHEFIKFKKLIPSLKEQIKIANFLSAIDKNIELVNTKIEQTKGYKKGLLQQMFV
ncbi:type I restriction enzyme, S subunit [Mesonia phycicola]|uniref:Type I restriction enzyme, S subunit n=1 Tax=Mesonia phycicola TaxID=579105 RepID=A0A1M6CIU8_9FLAO|nr:restriction endonuclease subunit S [Mesonia phycicola]SHI60960.1 type I restriction enzyme, S subunit [Mesonia phycicola]